MDVTNSTSPQPKSQPSKRKFIPIWERLQQERAARDPAYAGRLKSSQTEARFTQDSRDTGGDE